MVVMDDKELCNNTITVIDFETTGQNPDLGHRACELAMIKFEYNSENKMVEVARYQQLFNPQRQVDEEAQAVHGITDEELEDKPCFQDEAHTIYEFLDNSILAAHYASFDLAFLEAEFEISDMETPGQEMIDTWKLLDENYEYDDNDLATMAAKYDLTTPTHRSLADVQAAAELLEVLIDDLDIETKSELFAYQDGPTEVWYNDKPDVNNVIEDGIQNRVPLNFDYTDSDNNKSNRTIDPLRTSTYYDNGYVIGYCRDRQEVRAFRLDRMTHVSKTTKSTDNQKTKEL